MEVRYNNNISLNLDLKRAFKSYAKEINIVYFSNYRYQSHGTKEGWFSQTDIHNALLTLMKYANDDYYYIKQPLKEIILFDFILCYKLFYLTSYYAINLNWTVTFNSSINVFILIVFILKCEKLAK